MSQLHFFPLPEATTAFVLQRLWYPTPHVTEHGVQLVQVPHLQSIQYIILLFRKLFILKLIKIIMQKYF